MEIRLLPVFLKLVAVTVPLTWLWLEWGRAAYYRAFVLSARPVLLMLGVTGVRRDLLQDYFINYLPFVALMVVTPGMTLLRRVVGTLVGFAVIYVGHIGLAWAVFVTHIRDGETLESLPNLFPFQMFSNALPFILWALVANDFVRQVFERYTGGAAKRDAEGGGGRDGEGGGPDA